MLRKIQIAFLGTRLLGSPFWSLLNMLVFILYKNSHITPLEITLLIALKPLSALVSPYWSGTLINASLIRYLPFLFLPWISSSWLIIFFFGLYMTLSRATIPTWMEVIKSHLPEKQREKMVAHGSTIEYGGTALLTLAWGFLLDYFPDGWRWFFSGAALLGLISTLFLNRVPSPKALPASPSSFILKPWKQAFDLLCSRRDFALFQIGFMLGGAGLMIMQPALPVFFIDTLNLSYVELGCALALCKGIGVALSSPLWTRLFRKINIYHFSGFVTLLAALFPILLLAAPLHVSLLYLAYIFYGVMQAGSELSWHMSGPVFAGDKDSSLYSSINVLTVGIRGSLIPALGALLLPLSHALGVMLLGAALCLLATLHLFVLPRTVKSS